MISRKTTISAAALLLASAGAAAAFPATATTDLNVRSGPGTGYSVIDQLQAGDTVEIVATRGSWYQTANGGWASGSYLEESGGQSTYIESGGYGPVAFYYDDNPYYYDDAGFYFYIDSGRRHRVGWDWFRDRDHRHLRWSHMKHRKHFEQQFGQYGSGKKKNWDGKQNAKNWDGDGPRPVKGTKNWQQNDADVSAGASTSQGGPSAGASIESDARLQEERASVEGPPRGGDGPRIGAQGNGQGGPGLRAQGGGQMRGGAQGGGGQRGGGAAIPQGAIPGGGY